ncbi:23S rRNA (pseudouridine(1915)-N(3))-methyltransferase RlmH [archaeon]|jgi:23S rRNA (pseudouridine1915-N3)-methyltransferase|nr:23S rRNA (pseudouridine(1915)-N(3))-methyltransferase RlmH [archaeon]MBT6762568.1 23S rRNA (pseudouridine(1915)-N(3))-methyltransferase RlmH [archaeon]
MTITLLSIGKVRKQYVKDAIGDFKRRLSKYTKFEYQVKDKFSDQDMKGYVVALDPLGTELTSEDFASFIKKTTLEQKNITFLIGGPNGIPKEYLRKANKKISLSKMTFPNELVRAIFLEQLYRAFKINKNESYHK